MAAQSRNSSEERVSPLRIGAAWGVHLFTASGAVAAFWAVLAIGDGRWMTAFAWMGLGILIDGVDGLLARTVGVKQVLPNFDGALLDNLVDYFAYVLVPALLVCDAHLLPRGWNLPAAAAMILSSAYQFCQADAKTDDHYFKGWPSYWNILVFYLFVLRANPVLSLVLVLGCAILVFVPIRYLYPSRAKRFRTLHLLLVAAWAATLILMWFQHPTIHPAVIALSLLYVVYYNLVSLYATFRPNRSPNARLEPAQKGLPR